MQNRTVFVVLSFLAIYTIWGSTHLFNKVAVSQLPPFMLASVRFTTAGLLVFIMALILGIPLNISKKQVINVTIVGFVFLTLGNGSFVWAIKYVDSGFAALQTSVQPLMVLVLMWVLDGKKIKVVSWIGVSLGILGMCLLVNQQHIVMNGDYIIGVSMIFFCVFCCSYGSVFVAKADLPSNHLVSTAYQMLIGGLMLLVLSLVFSENWISPFQWKTEVMLAMISLIFFGGIVVFTSFNYLLKVVSPEKVATSNYVNPIVGLTLGWYGRI